MEKPINSNFLARKPLENKWLIVPFMRIVGSTTIYLHLKVQREYYFYYTIKTYEFFYLKPMNYYSQFKNQRNQVFSSVYTIVNLYYQGFFECNPVLSKKDEHFFSRQFLILHLLQKH